MTEAEAVKLYKCLADKSRRQILKTLIHENTYVEFLTERLGLTPSTISFHLKTIRREMPVENIDLIINGKLLDMHIKASVLFWKMPIIIRNYC